MANPYKSNLVDVKVELLFTRPLSWKVKSENTDKVAWVPRSLCEFDADTNTLAIPEDLAIEKELV